MYFLLILIVFFILIKNDLQYFLKLAFIHSRNLKNNKYQLLFSYFQKSPSSSTRNNRDLEEPPKLSFGLFQRFNMLAEPDVQPVFDTMINELIVSDKSLEERSDIRSISCNPNAPYAYGFPRRVMESCILSLFKKKPLKPGGFLELNISFDYSTTFILTYSFTEGESAESLRDKQQAQLVEIQIRRAGDYIRQGQNFEAIQCCNNALNMMPESTDALLGRAIA
jgi:hypothetical protein